MLLEMFKMIEVGVGEKHKVTKCAMAACWHCTYGLVGYELQ